METLLQYNNPYSSNKRIRGLCFNNVATHCISDI